jgi:hypothetical protein
VPLEKVLEATRPKHTSILETEGAIAYFTNVVFPPYMYCPPGAGSDAVLQQLRGQAEGDSPTWTLSTNKPSDHM